MVAFRFVVFPQKFFVRISCFIGPTPALSCLRASTGIAETTDNTNQKEPLTTLRLQPSSPLERLVRTAVAQVLNCHGTFEANLGGLNENGSGRNVESSGTKNEFIFFQPYEHRQPYACLLHSHTTNDLAARALHLASSEAPGRGESLQGACRPTCTANHQPNFSFFIFSFLFKPVLTPR